MSKINNLESLRGIAALIVALYHLPSLSLYHIEQGYLAVYFFFSLSGFVIALNYFNRIDNIKSLFLFQKKRFFRLYPIHITVLLIVLFIQIMKFFLIDFINISYEQKAFEPNDWFTYLDFFQHIFLTQSITNLGYHLSWNGAAWTISAEFYTYFIFGFLIVLIRNNEKIFSIIVIIYLISFNEINKFLSPYINFLLFECLRYFLMGSLAYIVYKKITFQINDFFLFLILVIIWLIKDLVPYYFTFSLLVLIFSSQKKENIVFKLLNQKYLVYFGTISYSFYMIHHVIFYIFNQFLKLFKINFYSGKTEYNLILDSTLTILYLLIGTIISIIMYRYIEDKFRIRK